MALLMACAVLSARLTSAQVQAAPAAELDTARIQTALSLCSPGRAVVLKSDGSKTAFESAPLILPRGVTLFVDQGVTLYASRNPRDYDLKPASCGAAPSGNAASCKPFLFAYQAAFSGVSGAGVIDGQGGKALGPGAGSWWDLAREAGKSGKPASVPDLVSSYESQGFQIAGVTLRNAAGVHAAIYKTTGLAVSEVKVDSPGDSAASTGLLLSNALDASVTNTWIRVPAEAIALKASILGATSRVSIRDVHLFGGRGVSIGDDTFGAVRGVTFDGVSVDDARAGFRFNLKGVEGGEAQEIRFSTVCLRNVAEPLRVEQADGRVASSLPPGRSIVAPPAPSDACENPAFSAAPKSSLMVDLAVAAGIGKERSLVVSEDGGGGFTSIQKAVDALPVTGGEIRVRPGTYREVVTIRKPRVRLHGEASDPAKTTIVYGNGPAAGGTFNSATVFVEADDVTIDHLSIVNDLGAGKGQGVALAVTADRAIFRNLRILGAQDTLFAASRYCYGDYGPCVPARQYFADSYIEGNTDFIFGDSKAVFERCELHGIATGNVMYTAQSRHTAEQQDSGYVFDHCRLTAEPRRGVISLGRPWRPYATVVFLNARIEAPLIPAGWTEWPRFGKPSLPTTFYAEYGSTGPGANPDGREPRSHQLTPAEAEKWSPRRFLAGEDGWDPAARLP